ncbi:MAG: transcriptional repressor [Chloroflexi bacterium]|nr:transcriptional repressor [Chloroflexota bacterium]
MDVNKSPETSIREVPGVRVTTQRRLLLDLIRQAGGHLDADELYRRARGREPRLSLSTVYRSLRLFKELGLVEEVHYSREHLHFEAKSPKDHYHIICLSCGQVEEFESRLAQEMKSEVGEKLDFQITGADLQLSGYCSRCRLERSSGSGSEE